MIIRTVRGRVATRDADEFYRRVTATIPAVEAQDGLIDVRVGRQQGEDADEFIFVSLWRDLDSIYRWVGCPNLLFVPSAQGGYGEMMEQADVQHFEVFDPPARRNIEAGAS